MRQLAILTTDELEEFFVYDHLIDEPLRDFGWETVEVSWRDANVKWDQYDVVVIRSTWDYQSDPNAFVACLKKIESSKAVLENSFNLVTWNISKDYLKDLQEKDIPIVPTHWLTAYDHQSLMASFDSFTTDEIVIKPLVSANADDTYRLNKEQAESQKQQLQSVFASKPHMIQPFLSEIVYEGEYSLFYFNGQYSHCIVKVPKRGDFRVQEEHGGVLRSVDPHPKLLQLSEKVIAALPESSLYARIDLVRTDTGFAVMEIELIEPSLYFNMDPDSPQRFADALVSRHGKG